MDFAGSTPVAAPRVPKTPPWNLGFGGVRIPRIPQEALRGIWQLIRSLSIPKIPLEALLGI
eukprot:4959258-Pyramimonas_sp.AAC.1